MAAAVAPPDDAVTSTTSACPTSCAVATYVAAVAFAIGVQIRPFWLQRNQLYAKDVGLRLQAPLSICRVRPCWTAPVTAGCTVDTKLAVAGTTRPTTLA
jgi:hypothetical protein